MRHCCLVPYCILLLDIIIVAVVVVVVALQLGMIYKQTVFLEIIVLFVPMVLNFFLNFS